MMTLSFFQEVFISNFLSFVYFCMFVCLCVGFNIKMSALLAGFLTVKDEKALIF